MSRGWDQHAVNAYDARQRPKQATPESGCDDEGELHEQILQECLKRGWMAFHGSMAHKTFRTEGEPDFVIVCEFPTVLLVEAKTRKGKHSMAQLSVAAWAKRMGHTIHTVRSIEDFNQVANQLTKTTT